MVETKKSTRKKKTKKINYELNMMKEHDKEIASESLAGLVIFIVITICCCFICGYFVAKNRGKCFRKLSHQERQEVPIEDSRLSELSYNP